MALVIPAAACHRSKTFSSVIYTADRTTADQLTGGFYGVEGDQAKGNRWRWTGPDFSLALATPLGARRGARLLLRLYFPETQIQELGPMTLSVFVDGEALTPQTFEKGGSYDFVRDVPACFLDTNILPFTFSFNTYSSPSQTDGRELAAVVLMAALQSK
jgi:hypothetical protein